MLDFCAEFGTPCRADQTPLEFADSEPEALGGFEDSARYIADLLTFSEFSGQPIGEDERPRLRIFWSDLQRQMSAMTAN